MSKRVIVLTAVLCLGLVGEAFAQQKLFAVSGQGRGNQADARQGAQIGKLESENVDRKAETTQNASDISDNETRISANESELVTIQPHAKAQQQSCTAGEMIRWDGASYACVNEDDPTVGPHALTTTVPPDCHNTNAKLLWNASTQQWHCEMDMNDGSGGGWTGNEEDPQVGVLYNGRLCRSDGSQVICDSQAPEVVGNGIRVTGNVQSGGDMIAQGATFIDPIAAGTPTASNHLATKDYVDASTAAAASGGGGFMCGITRQTYTGDLGGLSGADAKCAADFGTGWRFATLGNIVGGTRNVSNYLQAWVFRSGYNGCSNYTSTGGSGYSLGTNGTNWLTEAKSCSNDYPLACCNF